MSRILVSIAIFLLLLVPTVPVHAASSDNSCPPGRAKKGLCVPVSTDQCSIPMQVLVDATPRGGTLNLPPCIYRETVKLHQPIRIFGGSRAELRGSDIWPDAVWSGKQSTLVLPSRARGTIALQWNVPTCADGTHTTCNQPYQVFLDGSMKRFVDRSPNTGEWTLNSGHVVLGDAPQGHLVEVSTRNLWLDFSNNSDVYIYGVTFQHSVGTYQECATYGNNSRNVTFEHNSFFFAGYCAVGAQYSENTKLLGNAFLWNSGTAHNLGYGRGARVELGSISWNNRRLARGESVSDYWYGWSAGGFKIFSTDSSTVMGVTVEDNGGPGIWFDGDNTNGLISNNLSQRNLASGIEWEGGVAGIGPLIIENNNSIDNRDCGILVALNSVASTATGRVTDNLLRGNSNGSICKGYNHQESQPGIVYSGNSP